MSKRQIGGTACAELPAAADSLFDSYLLGAEDDQDCCSEDEGGCMQSCCHRGVMYVERSLLTREAYRDLRSVGVDIDCVDQRKRYQIVGVNLTVLCGGQITDLSVNELVESLSSHSFVQWLESTGIECSVSESNRKVSLIFPKTANVRGKICEQPRRTKLAEFVQIEEGTWVLVQSN